MGFNSVITILNCAIEHDNKLSTTHIVNTNLAGFIPLCHIIPFYLLNWPISYNSIKLCNIINYVIEG